MCELIPPLALAVRSNCMGLRSQSKARDYRVSQMHRVLNQQLSETTFLAFQRRSRRKLLWALTCEDLPQRLKQLKRSMGLYKEYLPPVIAKFVGLHRSSQAFLATKNDDGRSFGEIADLIDQRY